MTADPRGHRRHREHRAAGLVRIRQLHQLGQAITCCLCDQPLDPFQPWNGGRNPLAPTLEHDRKLSDGGPLFQPNGPDHWAHKLCQDRQGQAASTARKTRKTTPTNNSRRW